MDISINRAIFGATIEKTNGIPRKVIGEATPTPSSKCPKLSGSYRAFAYLRDLREPVTYARCCYRREDGFCVILGCVLSGSVKYEQARVDGGRLMMWSSLCRTSKCLVAKLVALRRRRGCKSW
jgi:hypothetical protein